MEPLPKIERALLSYLTAEDRRKVRKPERLSQKTIMALTVALKKIFDIAPKPRMHVLSKINSEFSYVIMNMLKLDFVDDDYKFTYILRTEEGSLHIGDNCIYTERAGVSQNISFADAKRIASQISNGKFAEAIRKSVLLEEAKEAAQVIAYEEQYAEEQKLVRSLESAQ